MTGHDGDAASRLAATGNCSDWKLVAYGALRRDFRRSAHICGFGAAAALRAVSKNVKALPVKS